METTTKVFLNLIKERKELIRWHNRIIRKDPRSKHIDDLHYISEQIIPDHTFNTEIDILTLRIHKIENKINKRECHCNICEVN